MENQLSKYGTGKLALVLVTTMSLSGCVTIGSDNKKTELLFNTLSMSAIRLVNDNEHCTYYNAESERKCEEQRQQQVEQINQSIQKHHQGGQ